LVRKSDIRPEKRAASKPEAIPASRGRGNVSVREKRPGEED
jgi:hypothetical protein